MDRPSVDATWMQVARVISARATCPRLAVGAVLTVDGRSVSSGWNGAPAGMPHCDHDGTEYRCTDSIHAERNAVGYAARKGYATEGSTLYVTHAPCMDCASVLVAAGVRRVCYGTEYRTLAGVQTLRNWGVTVDWILDET